MYHFLILYIWRKGILNSSSMLIYKCFYNKYIQLVDN